MAGSDPISIDASGSVVRIAAPLFSAGARRAALPGVGTLLAFGIGAFALFVRHEAVAACVFLAIAVAGAYLVAALAFGRSVATIETSRITIHQNLGLPARFDKPVAGIAYGEATSVSRYGGATTAPIVARFEDGTFATILGDAGTRERAQELAYRIASPLGLAVEGTLPHRSQRDVLRLTLAITTVVLAPLAGLLIWLFISTNGPHARHAHETPAIEEHSALPAPK